jgi:uncharacterized protein (TIGR02284 family)
MKKNPDAIATLNALIAVNTKRFERYKHAADRMKDMNKKLLFMNYAVQSQEFINNLNKWLIAYGTVSVSLSGHLSNNFLEKTWTGLRGMLAISEKKFLLHDCESVERESIKIYKNALQEASITLPSATLADIERQAKELELAFSMLKSLRDNHALDQLQVA